MNRYHLLPFSYGRFQVINDDQIIFISSVLTSLLPVTIKSTFYDRDYFFISQAVTNTIFTLHGSRNHRAEIHISKGNIVHFDIVRHDSHRESFEMIAHLTSDQFDLTRRSTSLPLIQFSESTYNLKTSYKILLTDHYNISVSLYILLFGCGLILSRKLPKKSKYII